MSSNSRQKENSFKWATFASDCFGLSSFHVNHVLQKMYRCVIFVSIFFGHFTLINVVDTNIEIFLYDARFWCLFLSYAVILFLQYLREDCIRKCHRGCSQFPSVFAFWRIVFNLALHFSNLFIYWFIYRITFLRIFFYVFILYFIVRLPSIQFCYLMTSVQKKMVILNRKLEDLLNENKKQLPEVHTKNKEIARIHDEYMNLTDLANFIVSTYSYQLLIILGQTSLEILFILQITFFDILTGNQTINGNLDFTLRTYILLSHFYKLCVVITPGENYLNEMKRTDKILRKLMNFSNIKHSEVREFILQRITDPCPLSILGLFQLDYRLLYTIGCGAINYGLIIGMFHLGRPNIKNEFQ